MDSQNLLLVGVAVAALYFMMPMGYSRTGGFGGWWGAPIHLRRWGPGPSWRWGGGWGGWGGPRGRGSVPPETMVIGLLAVIAIAAVVSK